jgi:pimeloyl-ACP methyl ester carboxylesterase
MRMAVQDRVSGVITNDTRIVVAHSLGSVVAYEALCAHPEWNVDTLITLGSPLGIRKLVFDILQPAPSNARGTRPKVRQWINIADEGDIVALEKKLDPLFGGVDDRSVYNGWKSHDVKRYLTAKVTAEAIASGFA